MVEAFQQNMGGTSSNETLNKMFEEMANNLPLRGLVLFSRGKVSMQQIQLMIALLNYQFFTAARLWWQIRRSQSENRKSEPPAE